MEKGYLITSVGALSWKTGGAEEQEGRVGQISRLPGRKAKESSLLA